MELHPDTFCTSLTADIDDDVICVSTEAEPALIRAKAIAWLSLREFLWQDFIQQVGYRACLISPTSENNEFYENDE